MNKQVKRKMNEKANKEFKGGCCNWEDYSIDEYEPNKSKVTPLPEHKVETNVGELIYYLEEMYSMDMLDDTETDIYERYTYGEKINKSEWLYVYKQLYKLQFEKF